MKAGASKVSDATGDLISNVDINNPIYDEKNHVLFFTAPSNVEGVGRINGLISVVLTEKGAINVYGYAVENEFKPYVNKHVGWAKA